MAFPFPGVDKDLSRCTRLRVPRERGTQRRQATVPRTVIRAVPRHAQCKPVAATRAARGPG